MVHPEQVSDKQLWDWNSTQLSLWGCIPTLQYFGISVCLSTLALCLYLQKYVDVCIYVNINRLIKSIHIQLDQLHGYQWQDSLKLH